MLAPLQKFDRLRACAVEDEDAVLDDVAHCEGGNHQGRRGGGPQRSKHCGIGDKRRHDDDHRDGDNDGRRCPGADQQAGSDIGRWHDEGVGADGDHVAMSEIDQPQDAEQQADTKRRQRVDAAEREGVDQVLQELDHAAVSTRGVSPPPKPK